jgi:hypothetical protein
MRFEIVTAFLKMLGEQKVNVLDRARAEGKLVGVMVDQGVAVYSCVATEMAES